MNIRPWWQTALIVAGLMALGLFSANIGLRWVIKSGEVTIPDLKGENIVNALEQLNKLNLRLETAGREFHPDIPSNHIISQRPAANSLVKSGRKIKVVISKGAQLVEIPVLMGKSWYEAQTVLRKSGFSVGLLSTVHTADQPRQILGQAPLAGIFAQRGSKVNLLVSEGAAPEFYLMPDFIGKQLSLVRRQLKRMNLSLGNVARKAYQGLVPETVINQFPAAGFRIQQGKLVDLTVSKGK